MKGTLLKVGAFLLVATLVLYVLGTKTMTGRILSLYAFGGFWATPSIKWTCAHEATNRVAEKFTLPLKFDEATKNELREFWHFSYYRACLFEKGYDFGGRIIKRSTVEPMGTNARYTNYFGGFTLEASSTMRILEDNAVDPDIEDRRVSSAILVNDSPVTVLAFRTYETANSLDTFEPFFEHFSSSTGSAISSERTTNSHGIETIVREQDDGLYGFAALIPSTGRFMQVFAPTENRELIDSLRNSLTLLTS